MSIRRQFVLDRKTDRLVKELAREGYGSRSRVVRDAVALLAEREAMFERIESDPDFIAMMERSEKDFRAGRVVSHEEVVRRHLAMKKKGK